MKLIETTIHKLVAFVKEGYFEELIKLTKEDSDFRDSIIELEKLVNVNYAFTTKSFNLDFCLSLKDYEIEALIKTFTILDGAIESLTFGSESPVLSLLARIQDLDYKNYEELVDWIFKNRTNVDILPNGWQQYSEVKSLREYRLHEELRKLEGELFRIQNNIKGIKKQLKNPNKATQDLIDAIKRKDIRALDKLIDKGAELYIRGDDGRTLKQQVDELKQTVGYFGR